MRGIILYPLGNTPALLFARKVLEERGIAFASQPSDSVTHLLLPVPSFDPEGNVRGGGNLASVLSQLTKEVTVVGGNLNHPALAKVRTIDLLQDPLYLAENAYLTADCAGRLAGNHLSVAWRGCPVLILGWGRIGKCLGMLLHGLGAEVWISARRQDSRAMATALGFRAVAPENLIADLSRYRAIFNTVPAPMLTEELSRCHPGCLQMDLASSRGLEGEKVLWAKGLPGKEVPESSGMLIADSLLRLLGGEERHP